MGGVGKTSLAKRIAADPEVEGRFPDGTLWASVDRSDAMAVLESFGRALGVEVSAAGDVDSRAAELRSALSGRRVLLVLDDAWRPGDVEPLLPGHGASAALVTTRDEALARLVAESVVAVGTLPGEGAAELFERGLGRPLEPGEEDAWAELASLLGGLPLAVELAAKRARQELAHASGSLQAFASDLRDREARLGLGLADHAVRATFELSFERVLDDSGRLRFRAVGLFAQGVDVDGAALAAIWQADEAEARRAALELCDLSLLTQVDRDAYVLHPLLRDYAVEKLAELDDQDVRGLHERASDHYFARATEGGAAESYEDIFPVLLSHWHAARAGDEERARRVFPWFGDVPVMGFLKNRLHYEALLVLLADDVALASTDAGRAASETWLAEAELDVGRVGDALPRLEHALAHYEATDYELMVSKVGFMLGQAYLAIGDHDHAIEAFERAKAVDERLGNVDGAALTMKQIGDSHLARGDLEGARVSYEQARALAEEAGAPRSEAIALVALSSLAEPEEALFNLDRARTLQPVQRPIQIGSGEQGFVVSEPFVGSDGAELLRRIGAALVNLAINGVPGESGAAVAGRAVDTYLRAVELARAGGDPSGESRLLYDLGNVLEHWFLVDGESPTEGATPALEGAVAAYELADRVDGALATPAANPRERIETRVRPRVGDDFEAMAARVSVDPEAALHAALETLTPPAR